MALDTAGFFIDHVGGKEMREILGYAVRQTLHECLLAYLDIFILSYLPKESFKKTTKKG